MISGNRTASGGLAERAHVKQTMHEMRTDDMRSLAVKRKNEVPASVKAQRE
jgi:hypothetical protein